MKKKYAQWFWFIGGFAVGFTLISIGHAALPKKAVVATQPNTKGQTLTELRAAKAGTPELESDFAKLATQESRFAENAEQQKKLKAAVANGKYRSKN